MHFLDKMTHLFFSKTKALKSESVKVDKLSMQFHIKEVTTFKLLIKNKTVVVN